MTPLTPNSSIAMPAPHRRLIRRTAAVAAGLLVVGGTPLVAAAIGADTDPSGPTDTPPGNEQSFDASELGREFAVELLAPLAFSSDDPTSAAQPDDPAPAAAGDTETDANGNVQSFATSADAETEVDTTVEQAIAITVAVLADTYEWDELGPRVELLQQALGMAVVDGRYSEATLNAHRSALEAAEMSTDALPSLPASLLPDGPSPAQWAALRDCESGGDYTITNPSGKYRGAYQFNQSTWNSVAERHAPDLVGVDPATAAPADQDAMAMALYSERGAQPWPSCGRHL